MHYQTIDNFYPRAKILRKYFDKNFADPLAAHAERFQWDYWHVPGEYTHLRTPAYHYFPKAQYEHFHRYLVQWGRANLGCHDISPPWLSCYIDGCQQHPHQDQPHGPLAFVYSLTTHKLNGGETFIRRPRTLITPKFNRLTLFNPSLTHGVKKVRGTHDPRHGRLVIHGWFVNPRPFWIGPYTPKGVQATLDRGLSQIPWRRLKISAGFAAYRLKVSARGRVIRIQSLADTFPGANRATQLLPYLETLNFPPSPRGATVTLPFRID